MRNTLRLLMLFFSLAIFISACTPEDAGSARGFSYIWYVATRGDNTDTCDEPARACATLAGALTKAGAETTRQERAYAGESITVVHTINVDEGVYEEGAPREGSPFASIRLNVTVIGEGQGVTIFDSLGLYGGIYIDGDIAVTLRNFTVRNVNGNSPDSCVNIRGAAATTIENVTVRSCERSGISHISTGPLTLINVNVNRTLEWEERAGYGFGVSSSGDLIIEGGHFFLNAGSGIATSGTLTMRGGLVDRNQREGIYLSSATATLDGVEIVGNGTDESFRAGLFLGAEAVATVSNSTISENEYGAWLRGAGASLNLIDSRVSGHPRTGIVVSEGELRLTRTLVSGNASFYAGTGLGGGLSVDNGARAILRESEISGNLNGGITNAGELFLVGSSVSGNDGGMPALFNDVGATTVIEQSLIANNTLTGTPVTGLHVVDNRGTMNIVNATISGNQGAGISNFGALNLAYSTVAFNEGYGVMVLLDTATAWLAGDIIAGHENDCFYRVGAALTYDGANIDTDGSCNTTLMIPLADLQLGALADNGGSTLTHALQPGSPAIDAATSRTCPSHDQRVTRRPFGPSCDLGAYEASGSTLSLETTLEADTPTPEFLTPIFVFTQNALCRSGPSTTYPAINSYNDKDEIAIAGRNSDNSWFRLAMQPAGHCWVSIVTGTPQGPWQALQVFGAPPTATTEPVDDPDPATHTPQPQPTVTATCYYDQNNAYICP